MFDLSLGIILNIVRYVNLIYFFWSSQFQMQIKEASDLYVQCSAVCFNRCVMNFTARKLNEKEVCFIYFLFQYFVVILAVPTYTHFYLIFSLIVWKSAPKNSPKWTSVWHCASLKWIRMSWLSSKMKKSRNNQYVII